ncbi:MAG: hypothetical protein IJQ12_04560 [Lachnospiraceae bacterium]|nr:hypothetical protein [Lachnospiraceae bacterium]
MITGRTGAKGYVLGYDLGNDVSQISFMELDSASPRTLSVKTGEEVYDIPTLLARREDVNQWFFGREAAKQIAEQGAIRVDNLIGMALKGIPVTVGDTEYDPVSLLALFVKRSLSLLSMEVDAARVRAVMFTCAHLDAGMVEVLRNVVKALQLPMKHVYFQSYAESFYQYMIAQSKELRSHTSLACDYHFGTMRVYALSFNLHTTPVVASVEEQAFPEMEYNIEGLPQDPAHREKALNMLDEQFLKIAEHLTKGRVVSTVYLLGNGFKEGWMNRSLEYMCRTRKVFQGSNLFSKGATHAAAMRLKKKVEADAFLLLDEEKLKFNIGMTVHERGKEVYFGLLNGGINWFEASARCEVILETGEELTFQVTPLTGGVARELKLSVSPLPEREPRTTRLLIRAKMLSADRLAVKVKDLGFGDYNDATDAVFTGEYQL